MKTDYSEIATIYDKQAPASANFTTLQLAYNYGNVSKEALTVAARAAERTWRQSISEIRALHFPAAKQRRMMKRFAQSMEYRVMSAEACIRWLQTDNPEDMIAIEHLGVTATQILKDFHKDLFLYRLKHAKT